MLIEVFKTGVHKDSNGNAQAYTAEMLDQIVSNYSTQIQEDPNNLAPLVKGHPKSNEPALGWVKKLCRRGKKLIAKIGNIDPDLMTDIKADKFKNFSIALYPSMQLRHIGILGAVPPAVKGLNRNGIVYFHDDKQFKEYNTDTLQNDPMQTNIEAEIDRQSTEIDKQHAEMEELKEYLNSTCQQAVLPANETKETVNNMADDLVNKLQATNTLLVKQIKTLEKQVRSYEYSEYVNSVVMNNNFAWTPAQKSALVDILEMAHSAGAETNCTCSNYAEGSGYIQNANQQLTGKIKSFVESLDLGKPATSKASILDELELNNNGVAQFEAKVPFADMENTDVKTDSVRHKMHLEALAYCKQHPASTYSDAIEHLINAKW